MSYGCSGANDSICEGYVRVKHKAWHKVSAQYISAHYDTVSGFVLGCCTCVISYHPYSTTGSSVVSIFQMGKPRLLAIQ